ncbi:MAG: ComEA family DNA-binding protein [Prosthecobacter sp.]
MKTIACLLVVALCGLNLFAAEATPKKKNAKPKAPAAEQEKPSAKMEALAKTLTAAEKTRLLALLNEGDEKALVAVSGVGETRAAAIKKARPFADVTDVMKVEGIGEGTFAEMVAHAKAGFPQESAAKKEEPATEKKKSPAKKKSPTKKKAE